MKKKNHEHSQYMKNNEELIKEYENLRLFAIDRKEFQQGYNWLVHKGMVLWMSNKTADIMRGQTANLSFFEDNQFKKAQNSEIKKTIVDIILKKIRGKKNDEPSKNVKQPLTAQCLFVQTVNY
jgi:hypothetical protein